MLSEEELHRILLGPRVHAAVDLSARLEPQSRGAPTRTTRFGNFLNR